MTGRSVRLGASLQCVEWYIFFPPLQGKLSVVLLSDVSAVHTSTSFATLENAPSAVLPKTSCLSAHKTLNKLKMFFFPLPFFHSFPCIHLFFPPLLYTRLISTRSLQTRLVSSCVIWGRIESWQNRLNWQWALEARRRFHYYRSTTQPKGLERTQH